MKEEINDKNKIIQRSAYQTTDSIYEEVFDPFLVPEKQFIGYSLRDGKTFTTECIELGDGTKIIPNRSILIESSVVLLPTHAVEYTTELELANEITVFIHKYVDVHPFYEKLASHYVLMSWVFDRCSVVPYLRAIGDYGTGKTRFIQTVGSLCYKPIFIAGAITPSPIFRMIEDYQGTMVFNEMDFDDRESELYSTLIKILNNGYEKRMVVLRTEGDKNREVKAYKTFSPKVFSTRKRFKDQALESRIITVPMQQTTRTDLPIMLPEFFWQEAEDIRNKLLMYRFRNLRRIKTEDKSSKLTGIEPRLKQTLLPLLEVVEDLKVEEGLIEYAKNFQKQLIVDRGSELEGLIFSKLADLFKLNAKVTVKDVGRAINTDLEDEKYKPSFQKVGRIIRDLGFKTRRSTGGLAEIIRNDEQVRYLSDRYGIESSPTSLSSLSQQPSQINQSEVSEDSEVVGKEMTAAEVAEEYMRLTQEGV